MKPTFLVIGKKYCPACNKAKALLDAKRIKYIYVMIDDPAPNKEAENELWKDLLVSGLEARTVPQIFQLIGGADSLELLMKYTPQELIND